MSAININLQPSSSLLVEGIEGRLKLPAAGWDIREKDKTSVGSIPSFQLGSCSILYLGLLNFK